jgi:hypothetical protein
MSLQANEKKNEADIEDDDEESDEDYVPTALDTDSKIKKNLPPALGKVQSTVSRQIQTRNKVYEVDTSLDTIEPIKQKNSDDLWSEFIKDVSVPATNNSASAQKTAVKSADSLPAKLAGVFGNEPTVAKIKSETVQAKAETVKSKGTDRLSSILARINKEPKISTLQKSLQDWNEFKKSEEIEEELEIQNKGKNS